MPIQLCIEAGDGMLRKPTDNHVSDDRAGLA